MFGRNLSKQLSRAVMFAFAVGVVCMMLASVASAQSWNKRTVVTFSGPVEIPGVGAQVLPAGTYVFRLLDSQSDRHIVQVFNKDETHIYATILAIPNWRLQPTDKTVMTFGERASGEPQAIRAWFYPGDNSGQEFVYPKKRAVELARIVNQPVLYMQDEVATNITAPVEKATDAPVIAMETAPVLAVKPTGETVPLAEVVETPPVQTASLPKTASELPSLALMGFLLLAAGFSLRRLCDR
jgi:LPXTG-motif cell wall-anchored protein